MSQDTRLVGYCDVCACLVSYYPDIKRYKCLCGPACRAWKDTWHEYPGVEALGEPDLHPVGKDGTA